MKKTDKPSIHDLFKKMIESGGKGISLGGFEVGPDGIKSLDGMFEMEEETEQRPTGKIVTHELLAVFRKNRHDHEKLMTEFERKAKALKREFEERHDALHAESDEIWERAFVELELDNTGDYSIDRETGEVVMSVAKKKRGSHLRGL